VNAFRLEVGAARSDGISPAPADRKPAPGESMATSSPSKKSDLAIVGTAGVNPVDLF